LKQNERNAKAFLNLTNETVSMLCYLSSSEPIAKSFVVPQLCDGFAAMINDMLLKLAGKTAVQLKVDHPEEYNFRPQQMLTETVQTLLHLKDEEVFLQATVKDGRYKKEVFAKAHRIIRRNAMLPEDQVRAFGKLLERLEIFKSAADAKELELGDAPDEFYDALLCTVMDDPVRLPSGNVVDRATIMRHLLNSDKDPFTLEPLSEEMLITDEPLKARIAEWRNRTGQNSTT